jgi:hypothetical protein
MARFLRTGSRVLHIGIIRTRSGLEAIRRFAMTVLFRKHWRKDSARILRKRAPRMSAIAPPCDSGRR